MSCPLCTKGTLLKKEEYHSSSELLYGVAKFFYNHTNVSHPTNMALTWLKSIFRVGSIIYYDFKSIEKTEDTYWCPNCMHYFLQCPNCYKMNDAGVLQVEAPLKIKCESCGLSFVYRLSPMGRKDEDTGERPLTYIDLKNNYD